MFQHNFTDGNFIELRARHRTHDNMQTVRYKQAARIHRWATSHSERGYDVYFSCSARDDAGAFASASIVWCDYDKPLPPGMQLPPPSFVVASGRGQHLYWLLDQPVTDSSKLQDVLKAIAQTLDGDLACAHPLHFLRVPNTYNYKYDPPLPVTLTVERPGVIYTLADLQLFINLPGDIIGHLYTKPPQGDRSELDWHIINELVKWGMSDQSIYNIYQHMPIGAKARENMSYLTTTLVNARESQGLPLPPVKIGDSLGIQLDGRIGELVRVEDTYYRVQGTDVKPLSTFALDIVAVQTSKQGDNYIVNAKHHGKVIKTNLSLPVTCFNKASTLNNTIGKAEAVWWGSDVLTSKLRAFLSDEWEVQGYPRIDVVTQLGRNVDPTFDVYSTSRGIFSTDLAEVSDVVYVEPGYEHPEIIFDFSLPKLLPQQASETLKRIAEVNTPQVIAPMLGWFVAAHFKPLLELSQIRFPHLLVYGTRGAGKTTLITQVFQPLVGYARPYTWQANSTRFVVTTLLGSTTSVPISLTEFRESSQRQKAAFFSLLRSAYDFGKDARGRQDLTTVQYDLSAPVCIDGEDNITDPALQERFISVYLDVRDIAAHRGAIQKIPAQNLKRIGTDIVRESLTYDSAAVLDLFAEALTLVRTTYSREIPERMLTNQAICVSGLLFLKRMYPESPYSVAPENIRTYFEAELDEVVNTNTGRTSLSADKLVEDVLNHVMAVTVQGRDDQGVGFRYRPDKDGQIAAFHLSTAYTWWRKQQNLLKEDAPTTAMIKKQLREQMGGGYVISNGTVTSQYGRNMAMYRIDLIKAANAGLDIDLVE